MERIAKSLKSKLLDPLVKHYHDENKPHMTMEQVEKMLRYASGIYALTKLVKGEYSEIDGVKDHIADEIDSAEEYIKMGLSEMAMDETRHALHFIREAQTNGQDVASYMKRMQDLQTRIKALPNAQQDNQVKI